MNGKRKLIDFSVDFPEGESFDGPLDLLLFLIKKNEVDVYDLPVSLITSQYLEYLAHMEKLNLDVAGDFLVMAATLAQIKSRMLLFKEEDEEEEPAEDPRMALVRPLVEYALVREAAEALGSRYILDRDVFARGSSLEPSPEEPSSEGPLEKFSLFELVEAWRGLASRPKEKGPGLEFNLETVTIGERLETIREFLLARKSARFRELESESSGPLETALSFLAVLELARVGFLKLYQDTESDLDGPRLFLYDSEALASRSFDYR
ncbi:MAG: segregation/condensation protein A [Deltaproteobacteria bacterium]|jgi:segregation and condensation protein A|nr:segregation/condensation protein A [Deltaproteobacteria bacterium]